MSDKFSSKYAAQDAYFSYGVACNDAVKCLPALDMLEPNVKLVAFYLPQFHPIPENDRWWGKGFTEWRNVTRAVPQFEGHYQPHLPGELGFYDLRLPCVQERQVDLARAAGLSAFCFYFYWFNGVRLLEDPIKSFAENDAIDFEFCLCWANENWTRRWDGADEDILIAQNYSEQDGVEFISYLSRYLTNKKYLRVDGKPLLIVYRPSLLPNMAETAEKWRQWCRDNGIGEIFIACTQSFEPVDPAAYGLDGAVQFSPNDCRPTQVSNEDKEHLNWFNSDYQGNLYEYDDLINKAAAYIPPDYTIFRSVCPSWDNEARRPGRGTIFLGSSPSRYQEFLNIVIEETLEREKQLDKRLIFINAWNEWAEGAHLEPDNRHGYAFLEATRIAMLKAALKRKNFSSERKVAVIIHAFYPEILSEITQRLVQLPVPFDLFVTTGSNQVEQVTEHLSGMGLKGVVLEVQNRGRDVAPFLEVMRAIELSKYSHVLKLHTKKSLHREDGSSWRNELVHYLTDPLKITEMLSMFDSNNSLGILGPEKHLLSMSSFFSSNARAIKRIAQRLGIDEIREEDTFIAGTMFLARVEALMPIVALGIGVDDFSTENGEVDGTLAHAMERAFSYSALSIGLKVGALSDKVSGELIFSGAKLYEFAESTPNEVDG
ncbi:glycoside hydrolase family 99-like domain-containing protein [Acetobacter papayae]|uniref:glycoside hydrolase family 99-like domain-containing protein n=1 Tax=Acetobacter papayae TaxID=1076592 RepID=UPI0039E76C39